MGSDQGIQNEFDKGFFNLKQLLRSGSTDFETAFKAVVTSAKSFQDLILLNALHKKASLKKLVKADVNLKVAILTGYSVFPLEELLKTKLMSKSIGVDFFVGEYDNYHSEILDEQSSLYKFQPDLILFFPSQREFFPIGGLHIAKDQVDKNLENSLNALLNLCRVAHDRSRADIILMNGQPMPFHDLGAYRCRNANSNWNYVRKFNIELGLRAPSFVQILDAEFLANRNGTLSAIDPKAWFETKQIGSPEFLFSMIQELSVLVESLKISPKKVLVLDMDNTLYGGVVADDGLEGIQLGDTSARGQAFKYFQKAILSLLDRGVVLAVCSKNDHDKAMAVFEMHPEMVIKKEHLVNFKANWNPKSENIRLIAAELNLGLDSFVFVDDNPAEIEVVKRFLPEVATILLSDDPSEYVAQLLDSRFFEPKNLTQEDALRTKHYKQESDRQVELASITDMDAYLSSLEMVAEVNSFRPIDVPRISQLINKSNQFNVTTIRRTEAEVQSVMQDSNYEGFTVRLKDRFGDYGLISIVILKQIDTNIIEVDTWLMSCRVLKRQVEEEVTNYIAQIAKKRNCSTVIGRYIATPKNSLVEKLFPSMGFIATDTADAYHLDVAGYKPYSTHIRVERG